MGLSLDCYFIVHEVLLDQPSVCERSVIGALLCLIAAEWQNFLLCKRWLKCIGISTDSMT